MDFVRIQKILNKVILMIGFFFIGSSQFIQANVSESDSTESQIGWGAYPVIYYTPETSWAFGVSGSIHFEKPNAGVYNRPSIMLPILILTLEKQVIGQVNSDFYFLNDKFHIYNVMGYQKYPGQFFGIGNNTSTDDEEDFDLSLPHFYLNLRYGITNRLFVGMQTNWYHYQFDPFKENGLLASGNIPGSKGGISFGVGLMMSYDTRDHIFYPTSGYYHQLYYTRYDENIGSDYSFSYVNTDFRHYRQVSSKGIIALQSYSLFLNGNPPFYMLGQLGGPELMRGYFMGRYRDHHMMILQGEYRHHLAGPFGMVVFASAGEVARKMDAFHYNEVKTAFGVGFRFMFEEEAKINLRVDLGWGEGKSNVYITATEAF